jgi:hypothetical protein
LFNALVNYEALNEIANFNRAEEERKNQLTAEYISAIQENDIVAEVKRIWSIDGRKRQKTCI